MSDASTLSSDDRNRLEQGIAELIRSRGVDDGAHGLAARALELPDDVVAALDAERKYRALKQWEAYQRWKCERNPARAELERRFGYDAKHAMHLVRWTRTGLEVLSTGELRVRREDAAELAEIRDGRFSFAELEELARRLELEMHAALKVSALPATLDRDLMEALAVETILAVRAR